MFYTPCKRNMHKERQIPPPISGSPQRRKWSDSAWWKVSSLIMTILIFFLKIWTRRCTDKRGLCAGPLETGNIWITCGSSIKEGNLSRTVRTAGSYLKTASTWDWIARMQSKYELQGVRVLYPKEIISKEKTFSLPSEKLSLEGPVLVVHHENCSTTGKIEKANRRLWSYVLGLFLSLNWIS